MSTYYMTTYNTTMDTGRQSSGLSLTHTSGTETSELSREIYHETTDIESEKRKPNNEIGRVTSTFIMKFLLEIHPNPLWRPPRTIILLFN